MFEGDGMGFEDVREGGGGLRELKYVTDLGKLVCGGDDVK